MSFITKNKINFLFYSLGIVISGLLSFLFIPTIITLYGVVNYGNYTLIFNLLCIVSMFCYSWVGQSYIRFFSKISNGLYLISSKLLFKSLYIGLGLFVILSFLFTANTLLEIACFIPIFFLFGYYCFLLLVNQAKQNAKLVMYCEVVRTILNITLTIVFYKIVGNRYAIPVLALALFISYLVPIIIISKKNTDDKISDTVNVTEVTNQLISYGIPIAFFLSGSLALSVNDRFLITHIISEKDAGNYSAIYDIINKGVIAGFSPLLITFYPVIANLYNEGNVKAAQERLKKLILFEFFLLIIGLIILYFVSPYIIKYVLKFSTTSSEFVFISCILFVGVCLWQLANLFHKPLELQQKTKFMAIAVFVTFFVNIILNFFLLSYFRTIIWASITTLFSSLFYILLIIVITKYKKLQLNSIENK